MAETSPPRAGKPRKPRRERRLARHLRHARTIRDDPAAVVDILRGGLLGLWRARGGGLYGLGYVVTFVVLEARLAVTEFQGSDGLLAFVSDQLLEYLLRLGLMSFVNVLLAFLWPLLVLEHLALWGLVLLPLAYLVFERWLRPLIETRVPELRAGTPAAKDQD